MNKTSFFKCLMKYLFERSDFTSMLKSISISVVKILQKTLFWALSLSMNYLQVFKGRSLKLG